MDVANDQTYDDGSNRGSFNNVYVPHRIPALHLPIVRRTGTELTIRTYREPKTPSLFTALTMGNNSFNPAVYGHQTNAIPYPHGANIQLTVYNWDDGFHPFHFHGYVSIRRCMICIGLTGQTRVSSGQQII